MPELQNLTNAQDMVVTLFRVNKGTPEAVLDDYAKIAWFFTQRGEFEASLALISSMLWNRYCTYQKTNPGLQKNLFTSAIRNFRPISAGGTTRTKVSCSLALSPATNIWRGLLKACSSKTIWT